MVVVLRNRENLLHLLHKINVGDQKALLVGVACACVRVRCMLCLVCMVLVLVLCRAVENTRVHT